MGIRIGGASAFYGDSQLAARQLVDHGDINYLVFDYLAEVTMALLASAKLKNPEAGYATDFVSVAMQDVLADCAAKGIKIIANAGGVNVPGCVKALELLCQSRGLDLIVAGVYGDNLVDRIDELPSSEMTELESGLPLPTSPISMNAYLGAMPIKEALDSGAHIVVTGRIVDSAVTLGPLMHEFGWAVDDYNLLAQGALCGHVIECGAQCTGGNFTDWHLVPDFSNIGYPVAEVEEDGVFTISLPEESSGLVSIGSVAEQIVYEIGDPANYLLPDVGCDFSDVILDQQSINRVRVSGAKGRAPGNQYKVCTTWVDGYRLLGSFYMVGPRSADKAQTSLEAWVKRTRKAFNERGWQDYRKVSLDVVGSEGIYGANALGKDTREVIGKFGLHHNDKKALMFASMEMAYLATSGPPAMSGFGGGRARPQPLIKVHSSLLDKSLVPITVLLKGNVVSQRVYESKSSSLVAGPNFDASGLGKTSPSEFIGETKSVPLERLAFGRSGDKGDNANIGLISRDSDFLEIIHHQVTEDVVQCYFSHLVEGSVTRYFMPGLGAFNFLLSKALGGGGTASLRLDSQAKTYAQMLLSLPINVPIELVMKHNLA